MLFINNQNPNLMARRVHFSLHHVKFTHLYEILTSWIVKQEISPSLPRVPLFALNGDSSLGPVWILGIEIHSNNHNLGTNQLG